MFCGKGTENSTNFQVFCRLFTFSTLYPLMMVSLSLDSWERTSCLLILKYLQIKNVNYLVDRNICSTFVASLK